MASFFQTSVNTILGANSRLNPFHHEKEKIGNIPDGDEDYMCGTTFLKQRSLQFHAVRGDGVCLKANNAVAERASGRWEDGVVFSHRPVQINECIAVQINDTDPNYCGTLRIGFTSWDPDNFKNGVPCSRNLEHVAGFWFRSVLTLPIKKGCVVMWKVDHRGNIFHGVDGVQSCHLWKGVDVSKKLWAFVEVYGFVKSVQFVDKRMNFVDLEYDLRNDENGNCDSTKLPSRMDKEMNKTYTVKSWNNNNNMEIDNSLEETILSSEESTDQLKIFDETMQLPLPPLAPGRLVQFKMNNTEMPPISEKEAIREVCLSCEKRPRNIVFSECKHCAICDHCLNFLTNAWEQKLIIGSIACPFCAKPVHRLSQ